MDLRGWRHAVGVALLSMVAACSASSDEDNSEAALDARIDAFFSDASRLDLGDLVRVSAGYASDSLNDELSGDNFGVGQQRHMVEPTKKRMIELGDASIVRIHCAQQYEVVG